MKRIVSLLVAAAVGLTLFASCRGAGTGADVNSAGTVSTQTTEQAKKTKAEKNTSGSSAVVLPQLSEEKALEIKTAYLRFVKANTSNYAQFSEYDYPALQALTLDDVTINSYLGIYGGYEAVFITCSLLKYLTFDREVEVNGHNLPFKTTQPLLLYREEGEILGFYDISVMSSEFTTSEWAILIGYLENGQNLVETSATFVPMPKIPLSADKELAAQTTMLNNAKEYALNSSLAASHPDLYEDMKNWIFALTPSDLIVRGYYGTYNNGIALFLSDPTVAYTQAAVYRIVGGYQFYYLYGHPIYIYKNSTFTEISKAYADGMITEQEVQNILWYFNYDH